MNPHESVHGIPLPLYRNIGIISQVLCLCVFTLGYISSDRAIMIMVLLLSAWTIGLLSDW